MRGRKSDIAARTSPIRTLRVTRYSQTLSTSTLYVFTWCHHVWKSSGKPLRKQPIRLPTPKLAAHLLKDSTAFRVYRAKLHGRWERSGNDIGMVRGGLVAGANGYEMVVPASGSHFLAPAGQIQRRTDPSHPTVGVDLDSGFSSSCRDVLLPSS